MSGIRLPKCSRSIALWFVVLSAAPSVAEAQSTPPYPLALFVASPATANEPATEAAPTTPQALPSERVRAWQTGVLRPDRMLHGSLSMTLSLAMGLATRDAGTGFAFSLGLGLAKEIYDLRGTGFDPVDLIADALGAGIGAGAATAALH